MLPPVNEGGTPRLRAKGHLTEEQVLHEISREFQQATGGCCLPPMTKSVKGYMSLMAHGQGESEVWRDRLNGMIAEVGLEAAVRVVAANPFVLWRPPGSLARDISVYMEETGWSRGEVVGWMTQPKCTILLSRSAATVICNLKSIAAHLGLVPPRAGLLLLIQKCPAAASRKSKNLIKNLDTLQQLQATHPMWEKPVQGPR